MNSKVWLLLAAAAGLLLLAFQQPKRSVLPTPGPPPPTPQLFPDGTRVRLAANSLVTGIVQGAIFWPNQGWMYKVLWDSGLTALNLAERFLEARVGPLPA